MPWVASAWLPLETTTTRAGAPSGAGDAASSNGRTCVTKAKWPRWFTPKASSKPCAVTPFCAAMPALATSRWIGSPRSSSAPEASRTCDRSARSSARYSPFWLPVASATSAMAARPLASDRHAKITLSPRAANACAVARPNPVFAPVTMLVNWSIAP